MKTRFLLLCVLGLAASAVFTACKDTICVPLGQSIDQSYLPIEFSVVSPAGGGTVTVERVRNSGFAQAIRDKKGNPECIESISMTSQTISLPNAGQDFTKLVSFTSSAFNPVTRLWIKIGEYTHNGSASTSFSLPMTGANLKECEDTDGTTKYKYDVVTTTPIETTYNFSAVGGFNVKF